jgi:hypothetical protein
MVRPHPALAALCVLVGAACGSASTTRSTGTDTSRPPPATTERSTSVPTTTSTVAPSVTSVPTTRPVSPSVTGQPEVQPFSASISTVTAGDLYASWRPGCPVPIEQLRAIDVTHFGNDGAVHIGRLIVAADRAEELAEVFADLYDARFPIERMEPIDVYGGDDNRSISANNTSAFNCRLATGGTTWSEHAFGRALDINPFVNPYVKGTTVLPPEAVAYADRSRNDPGMIHADDAVVEALAARGWRWGGYWSELKDYQHFSTTGR